MGVTGKMKRRSIGLLGIICRKVKEIEGWALEISIILISPFYQSKLGGLSITQIAFGLNFLNLYISLGVPL